MKSVFATMFKDPSDGLNKEGNVFWHQTAGTYDSTKELRATLHIGSKKFPEYPIRSAAEAFYQLLTYIGVQNYAFHTIDIQGTITSPTSVCWGTNCKKVLGASFAVYNTLKEWDGDVTDDKVPSLQSLIVVLIQTTEE
jgi:hypothetical protein